MKIIFLDIDGVMNTTGLLIEHGSTIIGNDQLARLKNIVSKTGAEIVVTSTWRLFPKLNSYISKKLMLFGLSSKDKTIYIKRSNEWVNRSEEISEWLGRNPTDKFAILDDDSDAGEDGLEHSFFETTMQYGLTEEISNKVIEHLGEK